MPAKPPKKLQTWNLILLGGILVTALVLGVLQSVTKDDEAPQFPPVILTEQTCKDSGGAWNACGSACRDNPGVPCIEVCVEYCECATDDQCPFGLTCRDKVDEAGVCK